MSFYNAMFGTNAVAPLALNMLGLDANQVPRFRDAYFAWGDEHKTDPVIIVLTRTGGGNRASYSAENQALAAVAGYRCDRDDSFDRTFALFTFSPPESSLSSIAGYLRSRGEPPSLEEKTAAALKAMGDRPP